MTTGADDEGRDISDGSCGSQSLAPGAFSSSVGAIESAVLRVEETFSKPVAVRANTGFRLSVALIAD